VRAAFCIASAALAALGGCSSEPEADGSTREMGEPFSLTPPPEVADKSAKALVDLLVDRFDARECLEADVLAMMRKTEPDGAVMIVRAYEAPIACAEDLGKAFDTLGFTEEEPGIFSGQSADGTRDRVLIEPSEDGRRAGIEWEMDAS